MRVAKLACYNVPEKIMDSWSNHIGENLLPVRERAIKGYRILEGSSQLISSPTTSGTAFAGEITAVKGVMEKKKVVYLVPLKSLAEKKYLDFKEKYQEFGIKVVASFKDHWEYDRVVKEGIARRLGCGREESEIFSVSGPGGHQSPKILK